MIDGRAHVRAALTKHLPPEHTTAPLTLSDLFEGELAGYAELIAGREMNPIGFMTHGEGPAFTEHVRLALQALGMPDAAIERQQAMATWFEHKRGFFKAEWHRTAQGVEPLAAIYFRRRPGVDEVTTRFEEWGLSSAARERVSAMAALLEKTSFHFVSAAFRPAHPIHHKVYCSQWVTQDTRAAVAARIGRVFELFGFQAGAREAWLAHHERCIGPDDTTVFVSTSVSADGVSPTFKIDYPDLTPDLVAGWVPAAERASVLDEARRTMALGGTKHLTFTGVRFATDQVAPALKYYSDVPGSR